MALENWRSRSNAVDIGPHDIFCAKLARMAMTFDKDQENLAQNLACKEPYEFNHLLSRGNGRRAMPKNQEVKANFKCTVVSGKGDTKVLMLHVKEGQDICGADQNSLYVVFAPPVNPHTWKMFANLSLDDSGISASFSSLLSKRVRAEINEFIDGALSEHLKDSDLLDLDTWRMNLYLVGYGFGGALAAAAAAKLTLPECLSRTVVTFGAPAAGDGDRLKAQVQQVRRFAHEHDPITRLFTTVDDCKHYGPSLKDTLSVTYYNPNGNGGNAATPEDRGVLLCRQSACAVQYAGIDFRTKELAAMYSAMPPFLATMMFSRYASKAKNLWNNVARWSVLAHKQGETRCPFEVSD